MFYLFFDATFPYPLTKLHKLFKPSVQIIHYNVHPKNQKEIRNLPSKSRKQIGKRKMQTTRHKIHRKRNRRQTHPKNHHNKHNSNHHQKTPRRRNNKPPNRRTRPKTLPHTPNPSTTLQPTPRTPLHKQNGTMTKRNRHTRNPKNRKHNHPPTIHRPRTTTRTRLYRNRKNHGKHFCKI
jgi:hypothetical protein